MRMKCGIAIGIAALLAVLGRSITPAAQALNEPLQMQPVATRQSRLTSAMQATLQTLPLMMGERINAQTFSDKVVVVTFFASWCQPCREEFEHLRQIHQAYHERGVEIIAVNYFEDFDNLSDDARLQAYLNMTEPPFTVVKGNDAASQQFGGITRIPTLFVYDRQGKRALHFFNKPDGGQPTIDMATLQDVIRRLI